ncbi:OmpH family outer membrane protein [Sphingobacterium sp. Mn56C]|uniref:OmpH family outer membrane protein n=1 Tax=Sphingobacterium sp. Mn56C TaxID=3395261 RepID=UPI003BE54B34
MKNLFKGALLAVGLFAAATVANAQQKIGHIDADALFQLTAEFKTAQTQLQTLQASKEKEISGMYEELQKKNTLAEEKYKNRSEANKAATDAELTQLGQEIQQMDTRIREVSRVAQEDLQKKQQELMSPIHTKVMNAINAVAKEKGYAYVFDIGSGAAIYYLGGDDITNDVKTKLGIK